MPLQTREYTIPLSEDDRIKVRQVRNGSRIVKFSVQYEALINSRWRKITRYDNAHGYPHRHVYYPHQPEYKYALATQNNNSAFTEAQLKVKKTFMQMKERYIILIRTGGGEV